MKQCLSQGVYTPYMLTVRKYEIEYLYVTRRRVEEKFGTDKRYLQKILELFLLILKQDGILH